MKSIFEKDFFTWSNIKTTWEYKTLSFIFRFCVAGLVIVYLLVTSLFSWNWLERTYVRSYDISAIDKVYEKAIAKKDFDWALKWTGLRPPEDSPVIIETVKKNAPVLPATFFLSVNGRLRGASDEEKVFWHMLSRYRLRYDLLRCGQPGTVDRMSALLNTISGLFGIDPAIAKIMQDKNLLAAEIRKILDFDAKNPARNDPRMICKIVAKIDGLENAPVVPEGEWAAIRHTLRLVTERSIEHMKKDQK